MQTTTDIPVKKLVISTEVKRSGETCFCPTSSENTHLLSSLRGFSMQNIGEVLLSPAEEQKWNARYQELSAATPLAGLFRGWMPAGFQSSPRRILYVGKATSGDFLDDEPERRFFNGRGLFWTFAREIQRAVGCDDEIPSCIAWSNISKISLRQTEADSSLITGFEKEAADTLETEIATAKPHMIVFVTGHFNDKVVRLVSDGTPDSDWNNPRMSVTIQTCTTFGGNFDERVQQCSGCDTQWAQV